MPREIRGLVAQLGSHTVRTKEGVDGLVIIEPWPQGTGYLVTLTARTWRALPDDPAVHDHRILSSTSRRGRSMQGWLVTSA